MRVRDDTHVVRALRRSGARCAASHRRTPALSSNFAHVLGFRQRRGRAGDVSPATGVAHRAARDDSSDDARDDDGHDDDDDARRREVERAADGDASTRGRRGDATRDGDGARVVHGAWVRMRDRCARGRRGGDDDGDGDDASTTRHRAVDDRGWGDWKTERARRGDMEIRASAHDSRDFARYDGDRVEDFDGEPGNDFHAFGSSRVVRAVGAADGEWIHRRNQSNL